MCSIDNSYISKYDSIHDIFIFTLVHILIHMHYKPYIHLYYEVYPHSQKSLNNKLNIYGSGHVWEQHREGRKKHGWTGEVISVYFLGGWGCFWQFIILLCFITDMYVASCFFNILNTSKDIIIKKNAVTECKLPVLKILLL